MVYAAAAELGDAEYRADHGAFFGSVHGTLNHWLVGYRIWMQRLSVTLNVGDVFTIGALGAGVQEVNPVTKAALPFLKQFRVVSYASNSLVFAPAIIWTGPFQSAAVVGATDLNTQAITGVGTNSTLYRQNLMFHKNAFALACVPMEKPAGAVDVARKTYKGLSVRVVPYYDGANDISNYRLDILFGVKAIDPRLAVRVSGT